MTVTLSTLQVVPRTTVDRVRGAASTAEPTPTSPTGPVAVSPAVASALHRATQPDYFAWLTHISPAAGCTRPIRLSGTIDTVEAATGARLSRISTADLPDSVIYKACGNRRARVCPSCARTYQNDAYQLLRAGLAGGKGIPDTVSRHPAVFATFTAPSFGPVHTRAVTRHTCADRRRCDCRPQPCHARRDTPPCPHARPATCYTRHDPSDPLLGQPLCLDCYQYDHHVIWNLFSGELWRRTKQAAERYLVQLARRRGIRPVIVTGPTGKPRRVPPVRLSHGKAAEFQARGAVHFHALIRLDGVNPADPDAIAPPPFGFTTQDLHDGIEHAANVVRFTTPGHPDNPPGWPITWGTQLDIRHLNLSGHGQITDSMVAGYLAKYATKSTEATGHTSTRITPDTVQDYADPDGNHTARLIAACWHLGRPTTDPLPLSQRPTRPHPAETLGPRWTCPTCRTPTRLRVCLRCNPTRQPDLDTTTANSSRPNPYPRLRRWAHMLGFGGHFLTKARRYSVTFGLLRATRVTYRRDQDQTQEQQHGSDIRTAEHLDQETTLIIGTLTYAGTGWHTTGDALLANTAAAMARAKREAARDALTDEVATP